LGEEERKQGLAEEKPISGVWDSGYASGCFISECIVHMMESIDTTGVGEPEAESFRDCQTTRQWPGQLAKRVTTFFIQVVVSRDYFVLDTLHLTDLKDPRLPVFINVSMPVAHNRDVRFQLSLLLRLSCYSLCKSGDYPTLAQVSSVS
jgi:hypothetical protein